MTEQYNHGPQAETLAEAVRDVGKWLNERPNRPLDLRHVAMMCAALQETEPAGIGMTQAGSRVVIKQTGAAPQPAAPVQPDRNQPRGYLMTDKLREAAQDLIDIVARNAVGMPWGVLEAMRELRAALAAPQGEPVDLDACAGFCRVAFGPEAGAFNSGVDELCEHLKRGGPLFYAAPQPAAPAQPEPVAWRSAVLDLIDDCPGLTMEQDHWLSRRVKELDATVDDRYHFICLCPACQKPAKEQPLFMQGYGAGLADGKRCAALAQPQAQPEPEMHDAQCPALTGSKCSCTRSPVGVDKAWARFCGGVGRGPDAPYPGMIDAFEAHYSQSFTDKEWRAESGVWAAAWKAAKGTQPLAAEPPIAQPVKSCATCQWNYKDPDSKPCNTCTHADNASDNWEPK